jgi:flagellar motor switch protein FliN
MPSEAQASFVIPFANVVAAVLQQVSGKARTVEFTDSASESTGKVTRLEMVLRSDARVRFAVEFGEEESQYFAKLLVGEPVADEAERKATVEELWRQIAGRATTELSEVLKQGDLDVVEVTEPWNAAISSGVRLVSAEEPALVMTIHLSAEALEYLLPLQAAVVEEKSAARVDQNQNLDLLLDVPLSVTLRFGERRMPLREILQLTSGAVIELDRHAEEPVELFLDDKVIARGNVVVVDGCYGLRVTEVCGGRSARVQQAVSA